MARARSWLVVLAGLALAAWAAPAAGSTPQSAEGYKVSPAEAKALEALKKDVAAGRQFDKGAALRKAVQDGHQALAKALIEAGADPFAKNADGSSALADALRRNDVAMATVLGTGAMRAELRRRAKAGPPPGDPVLDQVARLLADSKSFDKDAFLRAAAGKGQASVARLLLENGAGLTADPATGDRPLHLAARNGHAAVAALLLAWGADVHAKNKAGQTPLAVARRGGDRKLKAVLERAATLAAMRSARVLARGGTSPQEIRLLAELKRSQGDLAADEAKRLMTEAASKGYKSAAALLLAKGASAEAVAEPGQTALLLAVANEHEDLARLLIEKGANVKASRPDGTTPLHLAAEKGCTGLIKPMADRGAVVSAARKDGATPLHLAAKAGHDWTVAMLLACKAKPDARDKAGYRPLHWAAASGKEISVRLLVRYGAKPKLELDPPPRPAGLDEKMLKLLDQLGRRPPPAAGR